MPGSALFCFCSTSVVDAIEPGSSQATENHSPTIVVTVLFPLQPKVQARVVSGFGCKQRKTAEAKESGISIGASTIVPLATYRAIAAHLFSFYRMGWLGF